jgi:signal transduction histidine kinase
VLSLTLSGTNNDDPYFQGIIHDITNIKKAERETLQAEKFATTGRLVRTLSHEIRNPLTNIFLSIDQLQPEIRTSEGRKYWQIIDRNSKRIGDLVDQLLNSARPDEIVMDKVDLHFIIEQSLALASDRIKLKAIKAVFTEAKEEVWVKANIEKLKIAFLNIIMNAIEAMTAGEGQLLISLTELDNEYKVSIEDNGSGIKEENLPLIFEPYFSGKKNGMGFGLAATLTILQMHHAIVEVESVEGKGTVFHVLIKKWNELSSLNKNPELLKIKPE